MYAFSLLCTVLSLFCERNLRHQILHAWRQIPPNLWIVSSILKMLRALLFLLDHDERKFKLFGNNLKINSSSKFPPVVHCSSFMVQTVTEHNKECEGPWGHLCHMKNEDEEDDRLARCSWGGQEVEIVAHLSTILRILTSSKILKTYRKINFQLATPWKTVGIFYSFGNASIFISAALPIPNQF